MDPEVDPEDVAETDSSEDEELDEQEDETAGTADVALTPATDVPLETPDADWLDQQREAPIDEDEGDLRP